MSLYPLLARLALLWGLLIPVPSLALYDPVPDASLTAVEGEWQGSLTYRDYQDASREVTLPTRLWISLGAADRLVLHFVFDDGPAKTVHSYDSLRLDTAAGAVHWQSGEKAATRYTLLSDQREGSARELVFEANDDNGHRRYTLRLAADAIDWRKEEIAADGSRLQRNRYRFQRPAPR
ncbi:MAG TPA: hypothetical protein VFV27_09840 [Nevskiaceae bacterium]|nr:hypothetical protein [Nevskiaceae bacterium]